MENLMKVLDKGYVRLTDSMGSDLTTVNSARVSYDKAVNMMGPKDEGLTKFLATHEHTSPFRHSIMQFEIYAPLMVARQWWKYVIGSDHEEVSKSYRGALDAWNESSRRYITEEPEFYIPSKNEWRQKPANSKQGSGEVFNESVGLLLTQKLMDHVDKSEKLYEEMLEMGVAAEQARLVLPAYGMYVRWYWTASLQAVTHFLNQRLEHDAQKEIQLYAESVHKLAKTKFPLGIKYMLKGGNNKNE
jgi:thymidylate synthase (FAD)